MTTQTIDAPRNPTLETWRKIAVGILFVIVIGGLLYPPVGLVAAVMMTVLLVMSFFRGRYWCGHLCPRGSFLVLLVRWISAGRCFPGFLRRLRMRMVILVLLMSGLVWQLANLPIEAAPDLPGGIYGLVGAIFVRLCLITTIAAVFLALLTQERAWCGICPMGTMMNLVDRINVGSNRARILTDPERCLNCGACERVCSMDIPIRRYLAAGEIAHPDCIRCGACVRACPTTALTTSCTAGSPDQARRSDMEECSRLDEKGRQA